MNIKVPPGVFDILPNDSKEPWRSSYLWNYVESVIRETARQYGYREIRTPIFERTELFHRTVGETSDIVSKEMYTFEDRGGRWMSLRPEGTAPVIRAFIEHHLEQESPVQKLYYIGPMFRYERSQAGRYRQHHQFGAEVIGLKSPEQDAELIDLLFTLYSRLGLKNLKVKLNSLGDTETRTKYRAALQDYLKGSYDNLSDDSKRRFDANPLRILDSKAPTDIEIIKNAPLITDYLSDECRCHFEEVKRFLKALNIPYEVSPKIVRGLDYYNRTVFEVVAEELGAQNSIGAGGRYDGLIKTLGGPDLPALGFGTGLERVIQTMLGQGVIPIEPHTPKLYLIPLGDHAKERCFILQKQLRNDGLSAQVDFSGRKLGKAMNAANQIGAKHVAVIGDSEMDAEVAELKDMATGDKTSVPFNELTKYLNNL